MFNRVIITYVWHDDYYCCYYYCHDYCHYCNYYYRCEATQTAQGLLAWLLTVDAEPALKARKGTNGVGTNGVTANVMVF